MDFDASAYVKACLDASTKGKFEEYIKITNSSEEDAFAAYQSLIDSSVSSLDNYSISEEKKEQFRDLYQNIYKNLQYEVGDAVKNSDGSYTVPVKTKKLIVYGTITADSEIYITDYAKTHSSATEDELTNAALDYMYTQLSEHLQNPQYENNDVINIHVYQTDDNMYGISADELSNLIISMMDEENT